MTIPCIQRTVTKQLEAAATSVTLSFVVRRSSFVVRRSSFVVRRSSFAVRRSSFVVRRSSSLSSFIIIIVVVVVVVVVAVICKCRRCHFGDIACLVVACEGMFDVDRLTGTPRRLDSRQCLRDKARSPTRTRGQGRSIRAV